jgi:hypothetical protein
MRTRVLAAVGAVLFVLPASAAAQSPLTPVGEGARQQSCNALVASTVGVPDHVKADAGPGITALWSPAPAAVQLPPAVPFRTATETYNRRYEFVTRGGMIYGRNRGSTDPWRTMPLPACFAGRVASISLDDDELIALDDSRRIYVMDGALKDATLFSWSGRWGTPFWTGLGYNLPTGVKAWAWSVISPVEDETWTDPAGNRTAVGSGKVSHIWGLRSGGRRITFWDPWLPLDESYEMCGPYRGRFRAVNLSASGSYVAVIGPRGDVFTRLYDFDISGLDPVFFKYSYEDQRGKGDGAPIQLPGAPWVRQPKIRGAITSTISIEKTGVGALHRIVRVEGRRNGVTGFWERDTAAPVAEGWTFHATGLPLRAKPLRNPRGDTSRVGLAPLRALSYRLEQSDLRVDVTRFQPYCSPARVTVRTPSGVERLTLHHVDGLRQQARSPGLDDNPREQTGALETADHRFQTITLEATRDALTLRERGWTLARR